MSIALAPVLVCRGIGLFERVDRTPISLDLMEVLHPPETTHLTHAVRQK